MKARAVNSTIIEYTNSVNGAMELRVNTLDSGMMIAEYRVKSWGPSGSWYKFGKAKSLQTITDRFASEFKAVK